MELPPHLYNQGPYTTRPSTAKKIDLDPISKRTINPEYNQVNPNPKPHRVLQPSRLLNQTPFNPFQDQDDSRSFQTPQNQLHKRQNTPKVNIESQPMDIPVKRTLKACENKNYDYCSQIASLPFGNHQRPAQNDLSMMPTSNSRVNGSNHSWMMKKMSDFRSELENLPGSINSRIPKQEVFSSKQAKQGNNNNYFMRNTINSLEKKNDKFDLNPKKKYPSENEKFCVKEVDIRESKVKQFDEKKQFLGYSHEEIPIIKPEQIKGKPRNNYQNAFKSTLQLI